MIYELQEAECGYVIIIMAVFWVTEALPIAVTALLPVFLFPVVGIMSVADAAKQYINVSFVKTNWDSGYLMQNIILRWNYIDMADNKGRLKNKKISSFKSNENILKKEDGSYYVVWVNKASSMTL